MQQPQQQQQATKAEPRSGSAYASRHQAAEQRRRTRINERLDKLRELVPHAERANTAAFLETVIEYVQELQALLKCGPSHGSVAGKPSLVTVGSGGGPMAAAVVGSGPYGVATPGGGFEVLQSSQGPSGGPSGGAATIVSTLGIPASLPFFQNGSNGLGVSLPFQAAMGQGGGGHTFFQAPLPAAPSSGAPPTHHAFASPQQLASSSAVAAAAAPSAVQAPQAPQQQQGQQHFDPAQQLALQQMMATARNSGAISGTAGSSIDQLYLHAATHLSSGFAGAGPSANLSAAAAVGPQETGHMQQPPHATAPKLENAMVSETLLLPAVTSIMNTPAASPMPGSVADVKEGSRKRSADLAGGGGLVAPISPQGSMSEADGSYGGAPAPKRKRTPTRTLD